MYNSPLQKASDIRHANGPKIVQSILDAKVVDTKYRDMVRLISKCHVLLDRTQIFKRKRIVHGCLTQRLRDVQQEIGTKFLVVCSVGHSMIDGRGSP